MARFDWSWFYRTSFSAGVRADFRVCPLDEVLERLHASPVNDGDALGLLLSISSELAVAGVSERGRCRAGECDGRGCFIGRHTNREGGI